MYTEILESQQRLQRLFHKAELLLRDDTTDVEVRSAFNSYLCVRIYSHFETAVASILRTYVNSVAQNILIERFVNYQLRRQRNLNRGVLLQLVGRFSDNWRIELRDALNGKLGDSLDSMVNLRNQIAHGSEISSVSLDALRNYFEDADEVIRLVFNVCKPIGGSAAA